ncbi:MAG: ABC transporter ATP-binding protein [Pseudomonadota bacterium]
MTAPALLDIRGLSIRLPEGADRPLALDGFDLTVERNEIVCLVGESGSGKSLAAGAILRLLPEPDVRVGAGQVLFHGTDVLKLPMRAVRELRGRRIAMVFQEPMTALNPQHTVAQQIDEVLGVHTRLGRRDRHRRIVEILDAVRIPDPERTMHAHPHQISGGQRQRVMIAMALVLEPELIIADEPTTALDVTTQAQILKLIRDLQDRFQTGVLFITHDFGVVAEIADRVAVLQNGLKVEEGPARRVLDRPEHAYTRALIRAVPRLTPPPPKPLADRPVVLAADAVSKTFRPRALIGVRRPPVAAVKAASFELRRGETLGIVGESGSGKSTLARCIVRLLDSDDGRILLDGADLRTAPRSVMRARRRDIQIIFQDPMASLNPRKRVQDLIAQGPIVLGTPRPTALAQARELLALVGLSPAAAERFPHEFSGGQRQRIGIARALAMEPHVIVADEPVSALDVSVQAQVIQLLTNLRERFALSLLFVTHDLRVAAQLCDRVAVMQRGEIVEQGVTAMVFQAPSHPYTRDLLASVPGRDWQPPLLADDADVVPDAIA